MHKRCWSLKLGCREGFKKALFLNKLNTECLPALGPHPLSPAQQSPSCPGPGDRWISHDGCRAPGDHSLSCTYHQQSPPVSAKTNIWNWGFPYRNHEKWSVCPFLWWTSQVQFIFFYRNDLYILIISQNHSTIYHIIKTNLGLLWCTAELN